MTTRLSEFLDLPAGTHLPQAGGPVELRSGESVFVKHAEAANISAEVNGLRWLRETRTVPVPEVIAHVAGPSGRERDNGPSGRERDNGPSGRERDHGPSGRERGAGALATEWIPPGRATTAGAEAFGRSLAAMHRYPCSGFGAAWPGYIGPLPQDNDSPSNRWYEFYAARRIRPFLRRAYDEGAISHDGLRTVEQVCEHLPELTGPPEPPSRIHGDLWSGNVRWDSGGTAWIVDPAAHGGHRETDLAMLALFGCPHLDRVIGAYREAYPLAEGWRRRIALHQLHPLLVHAVLFGPSYGRQATNEARNLLGRLD